MDTGATSASSNSSTPTLNGRPLDTRLLMECVLSLLQLEYGVGVVDIQRGTGEIKAFYFLRSLIEEMSAGDL